MGSMTLGGCDRLVDTLGGSRPSAGADARLSRRLGLCTFTLAVALGAVLLLPFSIISNEVLLSFPQNYYIQWLNGSLIHGGYRGGPEVP